MPDRGVRSVCGELPPISDITSSLEDGRPSADLTVKANTVGETRGFLRLKVQADDCRVVGGLDAVKQEAGALVAPFTSHLTERMTAEYFRDANQEILARESAKMGQCR